VAIDQGLSSATSFGGSALAAGLLSALDFGGWAIAYTAFVVVLAAARTVTGDVQLILLPAATKASAGELAGGAAITAALAGAVAGVGLAGGAMLVGGATRDALLTLAPLLPALLVQDSVRLTLIAVDRADIACLSDGTWLLLSVVALLVLRRTDTSSAALAMLAWAGSAVPAALVGVHFAGLTARRGALGEWVRAARSLAAGLFGGHALYLLASLSMVTVVVGLVKGAESAGAVRAAQTVLGPIGVGLTAGSLYAQPEMVRRLGESLPVTRLCNTLSVVAIVIALAWTAVMRAMPTSIAVRVFGSSWAGARDVLLGMAVPLVATAAALGPVAVFRARQRVLSTVWIAALTALLSVPTTVLACLYLSTAWVLVAYGLVTCMSTLLLWNGALSHELRHFPRRSSVPREAFE
jgi:hypothetical protein